MRPAHGQVVHFSEDPTITRFEPRAAPSAQSGEAYVWAVDAACAPAYWFPRDCPRAMAWVGPSTTGSDRDRIVGAGCGERVHAIEYGWLAAMQRVALFAYRLPAAPFAPIGEPEPYAMVATVPVEPLGPPEPVGDLLRCHAEAGIQLRLMESLWAFWDEVVASTLGFSGIRMRNARPRSA